MTLFFVLVALPMLAATSWLFLLTISSRQLKAPSPSAPHLHFAVVVPAHDEEPAIARTVASLLSVDYPRSLFEVVVVADNCSDATALRAREAGAHVLERVNLEKRGKGYALAHAFDYVLRQGGPDAAVVVDADTVVSANLLQAFAARLDLGAHAVQADYAVRNPGDSWRTRLMHLAFTLFHVVRSLGRERLGLSCGLRGNGMCFSREALQRVPHDAVSLVEDVEHGLQLGEQGYRIHYAHEAHVYGDMVSGGAASRTQRERWEHGRKLLRRQRGWPLFARALRTRDSMLLDLALDLLVPPLAKLGAALVLGTILTALVAPRALAPWLAGDLFLAAYLARGVQLSGAGARGLVDLAWAPVYLGWKVWIGRGGRTGAWVRTERERRPPP